MPSSGLLEGLTVFSENTGLVVGRTLVDPSEWKVPVLVSSFGQETVMVEPFSEIGMIAQVSAIQPVMSQPSRPLCDPSILPEHLRGLLDRTSNDLNDSQKGQLANTLLEFVDLFPMPGSALTGHMDAVEHTIDTPIRCAPRRMSPQKIKQEEACVEEMLSGGQIEPSDSPCSAPVVLVTKKDSGTRFCVDYRWLNWICWPVRSGFQLWIWLVDIGRSPCHQTLDVRRLLPPTRDSSSLELCRLDSATHRPPLRD